MSEKRTDAFFLSLLTAAQLLWLWVLQAIIRWLWNSAAPLFVST